MYINEVVDEVRRVLPSEYTAEEMYRWCFELSSLLALECKKTYRRVELAAENGCFFLPDDAAEVVSVISGGREIEKRDMRTMGFATEYTSDGYVLLDINKKPAGKIVVTYLVGERPIRYIDEDIEVRGAADDGKTHSLILERPIGIISGDTLSISDNVVHILEVSGDGMSVIYNGDRVVEDGEVKKVRILRHITEKTLCPSPYDTMYIDFCTMKIAWYQRNYNVYNYVKKAFSDKLDAYAKYVRRNAPKESVTKIINYMI